MSALVALTSQFGVVYVDPSEVAAIGPEVYPCHRWLTLRSGQILEIDGSPENMDKLLQ